MAIDINSAINAYSNASKMKGESSASAQIPSGESDALRPSFSKLVGDSLQDATSAGYNSESLSSLAVAGKAELHELVTSVNNAELALNTVVAVRDRVINAYQEILRMPI